MIKSTNNLVSICLLIMLTCNSCGFKADREKNRRIVIGCYQLDTSRSSTMSETEKRDLSSLRINFLADSTFNLSEDTPYFFDTVGYWLPGTSDAYDYNKIYFGTMDKKYPNISFYAPYNENGDTLFLMQGTMPKPNYIGLGKIIFKKCNCGNR